MAVPERPPILQRVGNTPLLEVTRLNPLRPRVRIFAKAEWFNPGGSVKDRAALWMVEDAEDRGALRRDHTILEATSGNTGIGLALVAAAKGYAVRLVMPANVSEERKRVLRALGAEVELTDPLEGQDGAILRARELAAKEPATYWYADQYSNPANPRAHEAGTGPEIWAQTGGKVTHFVACLGTSGTAMGTGHYLKRQRPSIQVWGVEPTHGFHGIEGLKHMATSIVPRIYAPGELDGVLPVETDAAYAMARRLAREEGMLVGQSSGAALDAALRVAAAVPPGPEALIVTVFPDGLDRYLSTRLLDEPASEPARPGATPAAGTSVLRIRSEGLDRIRAHARETFPEEACGFLLGRAAPDGSRKEVEHVRPAVNEKQLERERRYLIEPTQFLAAEEDAQRRGLDVVGFYHSHPNGNPQPSEFDRQHAWPWYSYLVLAVTDGATREATSSRLRGDRSAFDQEELVVV